MNTKLTMAALLCAGSLSVIAVPASAAVLVYKVSDYAGGSHGLWTNQLNIASERHYSFQDDAVFTIDTDTGTATFTGTAINSKNVSAVLDLTLTDFLETTMGSPFSYKKGGGGAYNPATDMPDVDFFTGGSGTITIGGDVFTLGADPFAGNTVFQYGQGANAKNAGEFGGSAWLNVQGQKRHWDINFGLSAVPEPSTWALMILGFGAVGASMRSARRKGKTTVAYA